jgi:hypothetical protein
MIINGTEYNVKIVAVYSDGTESDPSTVVAARPGTSSSPTILTAVSGNQKLTINFTPPLETGGFEITNYGWYIASGSDYLASGILSPSKATSPITITGLTNNVAHRVRIFAINSSGAGQSSKEITGTPRPEVPLAPTINSLAVGNSSLSVNFSAPTSDGGSPITGYKYSVNNGATKLDYPSVTGPLDIDNLTNGTKYSVLLYAVNAVGVSPASVAFEGTPTQGTTPSAPTITKVIPGPRQLSFEFSPPAKDNGYPVLRYQYKLDAGKWKTRSPETLLTSPLVLNKLLSNTSYKLRLRALNASGAGASSAVVVGQTPKSVPDAPEITMFEIWGKDDGTSGLVSFRLAFTPGDNGGSPVTAYELSQLFYDGPPILVTDTERLIINGSQIILDVDVNVERNWQYQPIYIDDAKIRAINAVGPGAWSEEVAYADNPSLVPFAAPEIISIEATGPSSILIEFDPPNSVNVGPITGYVFSLDNGLTYNGPVTAEEDNTLILSDDYDPSLPIPPGQLLLPGTTYKLKLKAVAPSRRSEASIMQLVTTFFAAPTPPTLTSVYGLAQSLIVNFSPPVVPGGEILDYEYSIDGTNYISSGLVSSPITITGTTTGVAYPVTIRARNSIGYSPASNIIEGLAGKPSAPNITSVKTLDGGEGLVVYYDPPASFGGSYIKRYHYSTDNGATYRQTNPAEGISMPLTIAGLRNGVVYQVILKAENLLDVGLPSQPVSGTPYTTPKAPTLTQVVVDTSRIAGLTAYFTPPVDNGGSPVTGYQYAVGANREMLSSRLPWIPATVTGGNTIAIKVNSWQQGVKTAVAVRAVNAAGAGQSSASIESVTITNPAAPASVTLRQSTQNSLRVVLDIVPGENGGSPITHYQYEVYPKFQNGNYTARNVVGYFASDGSSLQTYTIPFNYQYGDFMEVRVVPIVFGADITGQGPQVSPIVPSVSGTGPAKTSNYVHMAPDVAAPIYLPIYDRDNVHPYDFMSSQRIAINITPLKMPCYPNSYIGKDVRYMQPYYTSLEFSVDGGVTFRKMFELPVGNNASWCDTAASKAERASTYEMTFFCTKVGTPESLPRTGTYPGLPIEGAPYKIHIVGVNARHRSPPAILNIYASDFPELNIPITLKTNLPSVRLALGLAYFYESVSALGTYPISYQWYKNEQILPGETRSELRKESFQSTDAGAYHVMVSNRVGSVKSNVMTVTAIPPPANVPPVFIKQLLNGLTAQEYISGTEIDLSVAVSSPYTSPFLKFTWFKDGKEFFNPRGDESPYFTLPSATPATSGTYKVIATNSFGDSESEVSITVVNYIPEPPSYVVNVPKITLLPSADLLTSKFKVLSIRHLDKTPSDALYLGEGSFTFIEILADSTWANQLTYRVEVPYPTVNDNYVLATGKINLVPLGDSSNKQQPAADAYFGYYFSRLQLKNYEIAKTVTGQPYEVIDGQSFNSNYLYTLVFGGIGKDSIFYDLKPRMTLQLSHDQQQKTYVPTTFDLNDDEWMAAQYRYPVVPVAYMQGRIKQASMPPYAPLVSTNGVGPKFQRGGGVLSRHACLNSNRFVETGYYQYDIEIYRPPAGYKLAWRYRGENSLHWQYIRHLQESKVYDGKRWIYGGATYSSTREIYDGFLQAEFFTGCRNPKNTDVAGFDYIAGAPNYPTDDYPSPWKRRVSYVYDYSSYYNFDAINRQAIRLFVHQDTFIACQAHSGALNLREIEIMSYREGNFSIGTITPYAFNLRNIGEPGLPAGSEFYSSSPLARGTENPQRNTAGWVTFAAPDSTWTPAPYHVPQEYHQNAFFQNFPEFFAWMKSTYPDWSYNYPFAL